MKKLLIISSLLICAVIGIFMFPANAATLASTGDQLVSIPSNVFGSNLHSRNTAASVDTFADTSVNKIYGPYSLTKYGGGPMAKYLCIKADPITGTTPQMRVKFQLISGTTITDTISSWTNLCEINTAAKDTVYDISALVGKSLVIMVDNTDSTACQIPGLLQFQLRDATTEFISVK